MPILMHKKSRAISLIEVLVTVAILSGAIVFIFRAFITTLTAAKISQNMTLACLLAEDTAWQIEQKKKRGITQSNYEEEKVTSQNHEFNLKYEISNTDSPKLTQLKLTASWPKNKQATYSMDFFTYLVSDK